MDIPMTEGQELELFTKVLNTEAVLSELVSQSCFLSLEVKCVTTRWIGIVESDQLQCFYDQIF